MLRRRGSDRIFRREIDRSATVTIDKNRIPDIPKSDLDLIGTHPPTTPPPFLRYPPLVVTPPSGIVRPGRPQIPPGARPQVPPLLIARPPRFVPITPLITPSITHGGVGFTKVIPPVTGGIGVGDVGGLDLEDKGKKISIYILIGAVVIVGFFAMRRK